MALVIDGIQMPTNCHDCDALGISDLVGLECPRQEGLLINRIDIHYNKRPENCPLKEINERKTKNASMNCREIVDCLQDFKPEQKVILFDEESRPMEITKIAIDTFNDGHFNHIVLKRIEVT